MTSPTEETVLDCAERILAMIRSDGGHSANGDIAARTTLNAVHGEMLGLRRRLRDLLDGDPVFSNDDLLPQNLQPQDDEMLEALLGERIASASLSRARRVPTPETWPPDKAGQPKLGDEETLRIPSQLRNTVVLLIRQRQLLREGLLRLQRQRDEAQKRALDLAEHLNAAQAEIDELRVYLPSVTAPPAGRTPSSNAISQPELPALAGAVPFQEGHAPTTEPRMSGPCRRDCFTPPPNPSLPEGLGCQPSSLPQGHSPAPLQRGERSLVERPLQPPPPSGRTAVTRLVTHRPPLRRKPDPATTRLGSYSMAGDPRPEPLVGRPPETARRRRR